MPAIDLWNKIKGFFSLHDTPEPRGNEGKLLRISADGRRVEAVGQVDLREAGITGISTGNVVCNADGSVTGDSGFGLTERGIIGIDQSGNVVAIIAGAAPGGSWWFNPNATGDKLVWASSSPGTGWTQVEPGEAVFGKGLITSELLVTPVDWQTQVAGTGKPEDNATLGATWGSNIDGQPSDSELMNVEVTNNLNVLPDPNFSRSAKDGFGVWWSGPGIIDITGGENGTPALRMDADGTINDVVCTNYIPAKAGDRFYVWIRYKTTSDFNGTAALGISSFDVNRLDVHAWPNIILPTTGDAWATATGTITVANGSANGIYTQFIKVRPSVRYNATTGSLYVDQIYFGRAEPEATVGAPKDSPLGGMTVQDSVVGDGVFFTANGIEGWKSGKRTFLLDAITGGADFAGNISAATIDAGELLVKNGGDIILDSDTSNISELIFSYGGTNFAEIFSYDTSVLMISPFSDGVADLLVSDPAVRWKLIQLQATDSLYFRTAYDVWFNVTRPVIFDSGINLQVLTPDYPVAGLTLYYDGSSLKARDSGGNTYVIQWTVI